MTKRRAQALSKQQKNKLFDRLNLQTTMKLQKHEIITLKRKTELLHESLQNVAWEFLQEVALKPGRKKSGLLQYRTIKGYINVIYSTLHKNDLSYLTRQTIINNFAGLKTAKAKLRHLNYFIEYCYQKGKLDYEHYKELININLKNNSTKITDPEEEKRFIIPYDRWPEVFKKINVNEIFLRFAVYLGLNFGLRNAEIRFLRIEDIIITKKTSYIQVVGKSDNYDKWEPKTENSIRRIPIDDCQKPIIEEFLIARRHFLNDSEIILEYNYCILSPRTCNKIESNSLTRWFRKISLQFTELGKTFKRHLRPHVCRYSYAWFFYENTHDLYTLSKILGHATIKQTEEYLALTEAQIFVNTESVLKTLWSKV